MQQAWSLLWFLSAAHCFPTVENCIGGIMVGVLASSVVDRGFGSKDYSISICCFSDMYVPIKRKRARLECGGSWFWVQRL